MIKTRIAPRFHPILRPWNVVLLLSIVYLAAVFLIRGSDPLTFVTLGSRFTQNDSQGTIGYDGQFVYFIATSPFENLERIDVPAYRYQRIMLPALARLTAAGTDSLVPWTLLLINVIALSGGTWLLEQLLLLLNQKRWYALSYGLFVGVFMSVRMSLNEPLAYGLVLLGIWVERRGRLPTSALVLAIAALTKETTLLFAAGYCLWLLAEHRWSDSLKYGLIVGLPFLLWQIVLLQKIGAIGIGSGGNWATPFEIIPFNGFLRIYTDGSLNVFIVLAVLLVPSVILPTLWGLRLAVSDISRRYWHPYTFLLLTNTAIIPFVPFSTFREPMGMLRFIVGLVIMVVLYAALRHQKRALTYSTLWIVLLTFAVSSV
jgi:hypothetical protein